MKKASAIFIICVYAISTLGFSVKGFYCCGKLKSVTLSLHEDGRKKCSKDESKGMCCKTKFQYLKLKSSHIASTILLNTSHDFQPVVSFAPTRTAEIVNFIPAIDANQSHAPPAHPGVAVYISNCVYRI